MYDRDIFLKAISDADLPQIKDSIRQLYRLTPQGAHSTVAVRDIREGLVLAVEKGKKDSLDAILTEQPENRTKLNAFVTALHRSKPGMAQKLFDSGMRPQDLVLAARLAIRTKVPRMLEKLFKIYGVDPEAKVRLTPYSSKMVSLFDYATAQAPDQNLESVEAHSKVLKTILAAIAAKKANAGVTFAATMATPVAPGLATPLHS